MTPNAPREAALLTKSHRNSTAERAILVAKIVPEFARGLVLNQTAGGLNPAAVQLAIRFGARQIWMPTRPARNHQRFYGRGEDEITIFDSGGRMGRLSPEE